MTPKVRPSAPWRENKFDTVRRIRQGHRDKPLASEQEPNFSCDEERLLLRGPQQVVSFPLLHNRATFTRCVSLQLQRPHPPRHNDEGHGHGV